MDCGVIWEDHTLPMNGVEKLMWMCLCFRIGVPDPYVPTWSK